MTINKIYLNIWDLFNEDKNESSFVQIESDKEFSLEKEKAIMESVLPLFLTLENEETKVYIDLFDSKNVYTHLDDPVLHYKSWVISISNPKIKEIHDFLNNPMTKNLTYEGMEIEMIKSSDESEKSKV